MSATPRDLAVLFADVSGSTSLYEQLGDTEALGVIERCLEIVKQVCADFDGRVVKSVGDEVMAAFPNADSAADAACQMQTRVSLARLHRTMPVCIHIGFQLGP